MADKPKKTGWVSSPDSGPAQRNRENRSMAEDNIFRPKSYATIRERSRSPSYDAYSIEDNKPVTGTKKLKYSNSGYKD